MNILIDARSLVDPRQGGVSRVARALVRAYAEAFPQDTLICVTTGTRKPTLPADVLFSNVRHEHISFPNKIWSALAVFNITSLIEVIQKRIGKIDGAFLPNIGFVGHLPHHVPTTLLIHDLSFILEPSWFSWKQRIWHDAIHAEELIKNATHLLSVSDTTKRDAEQLLHIPEKHIQTIPIGWSVGSDTTESDTGISASQKYVLCLGGGDARKNVATAIEAVRTLRTEDAYRDLELVLVGKRVTNEPWIRTVARPSDAELNTLYANAGAFLYPSWYEGYGLPLHEAASFGIACIASTSGALPETAPANTRFANPSKPHHWIEALREALGNPTAPIIPSAENTWQQAAAILRTTFVAQV